MDVKYIWKLIECNTISWDKDYNRLSWMNDMGSVKYYYKRTMIKSNVRKNIGIDIRDSRMII